MASVAPGQSAAQTEPICYNCGTRGHWVVACPEPTRDKPAGFQRWQSQIQEHSQSSERSGPPQDKKGPVVTRYPPPPGQAPAMSRYGPPPAPPPQFAPGPPPPISPQGYSQPGYPPPPSFSVGYPPPPPPQYGSQYPPAAPPPPPQYGQHPPYGQPQYPPAFPPPSYYPNSIPPPPPSFSPGAYAPPPQYGSLPPPPPPAPNPYPPHYPAAPPPPSEYQYPPGQPPSYGPPPPSTNPFPSAPGFDRPYGLPPRPPPPASHVGQNNHRGRQKKHQEKRSESRKDKHRQGHDNTPRGGPNRNGRDGTPKGGSNRGEKQAERRTVLPEQPPKEKRPQTPPVPEPKEDEDEGDIDGDGEWDPESAQDLEHVFAKKKVKLADPVGIPLPYEYSDEPTIPPAYNATCVKSAFFNKENKQEFAMPIRETAHWFTLKDDPVFKRHPGMVMRNFSDDEHDYPTYNPPTPPPFSDQIKMPPRYQVTVRKATPEKKARGEVPGSGPASYAQSFTPENKHRDSPSSRYDRHERVGSDTKGERRSAKRSRDQSPDAIGRDGRDFKRSKNSESRRDTPRDGHSKPLTPSRGASPSPVFNIDGDPWSPQAGESIIKVSSDHRYLDVQNDNKSSSSREERAPYTSSMRHDSGYHSGQSQDRAKASSHRDERSRRPANRPFQKRRSPSRSRSRGGSSDERSNRSRSDSPLTALEAGLLGLTDEVEEAEREREREREREARERKLKMAKKPVKRVKVAAAFSRRW